MTLCILHTVHIHWGLRPKIQIQKEHATRPCHTEKIVHNCKALHKMYTCTTKNCNFNRKLAIICKSEKICALVSVLVHKILQYPILDNVKFVHCFRHQLYKRQSAAMYTWSIPMIGNTIAGTKLLKRRSDATFPKEGRFEIHLGGRAVKARELARSFQMRWFSCSGPQAAAFIARTGFRIFLAQFYSKRWGSNTLRSRFRLARASFCTCGKCCPWRLQGQHFPLQVEVKPPCERRLPEWDAWEVQRVVRMADRLR